MVVCSSLTSRAAQALKGVKTVCICQTQCVRTHYVMSNKALQWYKIIARGVSRFCSSKLLPTRSVAGSTCAQGQADLRPKGSLPVKRMRKMRPHR